jgi:hypothetical protein
VGKLMNRLGRSAVHKSWAIFRAESSQRKDGDAARGVCLAEDEVQIRHIQIDISYAKQALPFGLLVPSKCIE